MQELVIYMTRQDLENLVIESVKLCLIGEKQDTVTQAESRVMNLNEFCQFTGFSRQTAYKMTAGNLVPFSKRGKRLFFDRPAIEDWLLENRRTTSGEAAQQANDYIMQSAARRRHR